MSIACTYEITEAVTVYFSLYVKYFLLRSASDKQFDNLEKVKV